MIISEPLAVSMSEAARLLNVSRPTVYRLAKMQGFPVVRLGGCVRVPVDSLREWVKRQGREGF